MGNGIIHRILCPILLLEDDNGCYIPKESYDLMLPSEVDKIIEGLKKYKDTYSDSYISNCNKEAREKELNEMRKLQEESKKSQKHRDAKGYIYLLECGGKYKIGYSNNVERRMKQLDTRPFSLNLITKVYSDIAFDVEQRIHKMMSKYKVEGEWYDISFDFSAYDFSEFVLGVEKIILSERG